MPAHFCFATFKYFSILQFFNKSLFLYLISNPLDDRKTKFLKTNLKVAKQKCVGTQCPGGCCPNQNWYCCPDNIHCASTEEYCRSKNVTKVSSSYHLCVECFSQLSFDSEMYTKSAAVADFVYTSEANESCEKHFTQR